MGAQVGLQARLAPHLFAALRTLVSVLHFLGLITGLVRSNVAPVPDLVNGNQATRLALELRHFWVALYYMLAELLVDGTLEAAEATMPVDVSLAQILVSSKVCLGEEGLPAAGATVLSSLSMPLHHVHYQIVLSYKWQVAKVADNWVTVRFLLMILQCRFCGEASLALCALVRGNTVVHFHVHLKHRLELKGPVTNLTAELLLSRVLHHVLVQACLVLVNLSAFSTCKVFDRLCCSF